MCSVTAPTVGLRPYLSRSSFWALVSPSVKWKGWTRASLRSPSISVSGPITVTCLPYSGSKHIYVPCILITHTGTCICAFGFPAPSILIMSKLPFDRFMILKRNLRAIRFITAYTWTLDPTMWLPQRVVFAPFCQEVSSIRHCSNKQALSHSMSIQVAICHEYKT